MYDVIIRKFLRHADGSEVLYEDPAKVNHERHAENLAAKIARDPGVQWVEIAEVRGLFKARANLGPDGIVRESLESARYEVRRKRRRPSRRQRHRTVIFWVFVIALIFFAFLVLVGHR